MNKTMKDMKRLMYASLLLLASCTQEGNNIPDASGADELVPLTVTSVSMVGDGTGADTRATVLPVAVTSGKLWVGVRNNNGYTAQRGLVYTYIDGAWVGGGTSVLLGKDSVSLYAYWPQDGYSIDANNVIAMSNTEYAAAKDLAYARSGGDNVCSVHPYAGFVLNHAFARLILDISFSPLFAETTVCDEINFSVGSGFYSTGTVNINTGVVTPTAGSDGGGSGNSLIVTPAQKLVDLNRKYVHDMLVVPSPAVADAELSITLDGSKWSSKFESALTKFEQGKSYRIKVVMGAALIIQSVEVETWTNGTSQSGEVQFE